MKTEWRWCEEDEFWYRDFGVMRAEVWYMLDRYTWLVKPRRPSSPVFDDGKGYADDPDAAKSAAEDAVRRFVAEIVGAM